jgi:aminoglycoside phosphotransferase (APT) family kinase protein
LESRTKRRLDPVQISNLVVRVLGEQTRVLACNELTEGMFNAVYDVQLEADSQRIIVKASPPDGVALLTYERDIMRTEAAFYQLTSTVPEVPTPRVIGTDFSRSLIDGDLLITSYIAGIGWHRLHDQLSVDDSARLRYDLGKIVARSHAITGEHFGYFQDRTPQGATWRDAFFAMLDHVFADAQRFHVELPVEPASIRREVERHAHLFDAVTMPSLVHFDLWKGNILLDKRRGRYEIAGLIDGERAMWADPVAEFAAISLFGNIATDRDFLAGYGASVGRAYEVRPEVAVRVAMYKAYLDLIILVEATPRGYDAEAHREVINLAADDLHRSLETVRSYS